MKPEPIVSKVYRNGEEVSGTRWVEPGQGATIREIRSALNKSDASPYHVARSHMANMNTRTYGKDMESCTNLSLTGAPLTADDLRRIAEAK